MSRWHLITLLIVFSAIAVLAGRQSVPTETAREPISEQSTQEFTKLTEAVSFKTSVSLGDPGLRICQRNVNSIGIALMTRSNHTNGHYPKSLSEIVPGFLKRIPTCPAAGVDTYSIGYQEGIETEGNLYDWPDFFRVRCSGHHHADAGLAADLPAFDPASRLMPEVAFSGTPQEARQVCLNNLKTIVTSLEMSAANHQGRYPKSLSELQPNTLFLIPKCPASGSDTYSQNYRLTSVQDGQISYTLSCSGAHPGAPPETGPAYDSAQGTFTLKNGDTL